MSVRKTRNVGGGGVGIIISENPLLPPLPLCVCVCVCVCVRVCVRVRMTKAKLSSELTRRGTKTEGEG